MLILIDKNSLLPLKSNYYLLILVMSNTPTPEQDKLDSTDLKQPSHAQLQMFEEIKNKDVEVLKTLLNKAGLESTGCKLGNIVDTKQISLENGSVLSFYVFEIIFPDGQKELFLYNHPQAVGKKEPTADLVGEKALETRNSIVGLMTKEKYAGFVSVADLTETAILMKMSPAAQNNSRTFAITPGLIFGYRVVSPDKERSGGAEALIVLRKASAQDSIYTDLEECLNHYVKSLAKRAEKHKPKNVPPVTLSKES
jgi:hypothetical protein